MSDTILFLLPYPLRRAPSQRFRVEAFFPTLEQHGIGFRSHCFLDEQAWRVLYQKGSAFQKAWAVLRGFIFRLWVVLWVAPRYRFVFVHREASPIGPPVFEWLLCKLLRKQVIYDFDDAIWIPAISEHNRLASSVKCFWKIKYICRWASHVAAGNDYLAGFARQYNHSVLKLPTCVDTSNRFNQVQAHTHEKVVIGWTGSHSTLPYLDQVVPVLKKLEEQFDFELLVICNQPPAFQLKQLTYLPWREATEIADLLRIHIGIMPLEADAWSEGKCGFKIIQYLSLGIPAVASPVGVNKVILEPGVNGYLCQNPQEWHHALSALLKDAGLRSQMGASGRQKIVAHYSIQSQTPAFLSLFGANKQKQERPRTLEQA